jgi:hypothetical protein
MFLSLKFNIVLERAVVLIEETVQLAFCAPKENVDAHRAV